MVVLAVILAWFGFGIGLIMRNSPATVSILLLWPLVAEGLIAVVFALLGADGLFKWLPYQNCLAGVVRHPRLRHARPSGGVAVVRRDLGRARRDRARGQSEARRRAASPHRMRITCFDWLAGDSAGAEVEPVALGDAVVAVVLLEPAEPDEAGDGLVDAFARRPDHACQLLLGDRQDELVGTGAELEQALGGAAGDVEEHRVGDRFVGRRGAAGRAGASRSTAVAGSARTGRAPARTEPPARGWLDRPGHRRSRAAVEHRQLAEQVAGLHQRDHALAAVELVGDRDRDPTLQDEVDRVRRIACVEQDVAAYEVAFGAAGRDPFERVVGASAKKSVLARISV